MLDLTPERATLVLYVYPMDNKKTSNEVVMDIRQTVVKWGNATAVRVPAKLASTLGMIPKSEVTLSIERGALVIRPVVSEFTLEGLLSGVTPAALDDEARDWLAIGSAGAEKDI